MDSQRLVAEGFGVWCSFRSEVFRQAPLEAGVYAIRRSSQIQLLKGESDIVYIGSAANAQGLQMRLRQYWHPGPTQYTNQRIREQALSIPLAVAWKVVPDPLVQEKDLLRRFEREHGQIPPLNRRH